MVGEHLKRFQSPRSCRAHALSSVAKSSLSQLDMHQSRWSEFRRVAFLNVLALFVVVGVMSESREEAGKPPLLPQSQKSEKNLKELGPLN